MPHRRTTKKGSFGDHFDELVKVVGRESPPKVGKARRPPKPRDEGDSIHDCLFEQAWKAPQCDRKTGL